MMNPPEAQPVSIRVERTGGCTVIHCSGRILLAQGASEIEGVAVREMAGGQRLILDLTDVTQIDTRGIGGIARLSRSGLVSGRPVVILGADSRLLNVLEITQVDVSMDLWPPHVMETPMPRRSCGTC